MANEDLAIAMRLWTGWTGDAAWPLREDAAVLGAFGNQAGPTLLAQVRALHEDFYRSDAHNTVSGLAEMGDQALAEFRSRHTDLDPAIGEALRWCYTYDYK